MNHLSRIKWISAFFSAFFIGIFEFVRHQFLHVISMDWGNLMVAALAGLLFLAYFHGVFSLLENVYAKLQNEKAETAVLQERYRIARELHDSVAQALFFMNIKLREIEQQVAKEQDPETAIREMKEAIQLTDADIRRHIFSLQRVSPKNINLVAVMREYLGEYGRESGIKVNFQNDGVVDAGLSCQVKSQLLSIFQELLRNIKKHAKAGCVTVILHVTEQQYVLTIADDGQGLDLENYRKGQTTFGLKMVEHDAAAIQAKVEIQSSPGQGTQVKVYGSVDGGEKYDGD